MVWEGLRTSLYNDANGFPTIGYGHKLTPSEISARAYGDGITIGKSVILFGEDISSFDAQINSLFGDGYLTQGQFDALVSFTYNLGLVRLRTMLSHGLANVPNELPRWVYAGTVKLPGLVTRRAQEVAWWNQA
jgi:GH24 family phage-related lysozyme (muramidase)